MKRVTIVILLALSTAVAWGFDDSAVVQTAQAAQEAKAARAAAQHRAKIANQLVGVRVDAVIQVERTNRVTLTALFRSISEDALTVTLLTGGDETETISLDKIAKVTERKPRGRRPPSLGVGPGPMAVVVGAAIVGAIALLACASAR